MVARYGGDKGLKHPVDKNGKKLSLNKLYFGYRPGLYRIIDFETYKEKDQSVVMKICGKRGVVIKKPATQIMGNGWLRGVAG